VIFLPTAITPVLSRSHGASVVQVLWRATAARLATTAKVPRALHHQTNVAIYHLTVTTHVLSRNHLANAVLISWWAIAARHVTTAKAQVARHQVNVVIYLLIISTHVRSRRNGESVAGTS